MNFVKYTLCAVMAIAALAYAGKTILGPTQDGLMFQIKAKTSVTLDEYTVTNDLGVKHWVVLSGGGPKTKIKLDGKDGMSPNGANILVNECKQFTGKKTAGSIDNLIFGVFSPVGAFNPEHLGIMSNYSPGNGIKVKLKGTTIGTVIASDNKMVMADAIMNFATDSGFKNKGAKLMTKRGDIGGPDDTDHGWIGIPTNWPNIAALADYSDGCQVKKVKSKGAIDNVDIFASGVVKRGKDKTKMKAKVPGGEAMMYNTTGWRVDKFKGVTPVNP